MPEYSFKLLLLGESTDEHIHSSEGSLVVLYFGEKRFPDNNDSLEAFIKTISALLQKKIAFHKKERIKLEKTEKIEFYKGRNL